MARTERVALGAGPSELRLAAGAQVAVVDGQFDDIAHGLAPVGGLDLGDSVHSELVDPCGTRRIAGRYIGCREHESDRGERKCEMETAFGHGRSLNECGAAGPGHR